MRSIGEFFHLLYLHFYVKWFEWRDRYRIRLPAFHRIDKKLRASLNPYKVKQAFPYGETPLFVLKQIADRFYLQPSDHVVELGCGRGRGAFFWAHYIGCHVHGIDWIPAFIHPAQEAAQDDPRLSFSCQDVSTANLSHATFIYLYGTGWDDNTLDQIAQKIPPGAKVISVTTPLKGFSIQDQFSARFPWGTTEIYLQKKVLQNQALKT
jgi:SAM-dependent methyltransferase